MARHSRATRSGSSWSPVLILLCLLICPLALLGHANAQGGEQEPLGTESSKQDLGDVIGIDLGTTYCKQPVQPFIPSTTSIPSVVRHLAEVHQLSQPSLNSDIDLDEKTANMEL